MKKFDPQKQIIVYIYNIINNLQASPTTIFDANYLGEQIDLDESITDDQKDVVADYFDHVMQQLEITDVDSLVYCYQDRFYDDLEQNDTHQMDYPQFMKDVQGFQVSMNLIDKFAKDGAQILFYLGDQHYQEPIMMTYKDIINLISMGSIDAKVATA